MKWKTLNKLKMGNGKLRIDNIIKILLANRGLETKKEIEEFLNPKSPEDLAPKDVGIDSRQIKKAVQRIKKAIKKKEKIIVYGDYDTDGICGTAILWEILYQLKANVLPFIPRREEGYGLRVERLEEMAKDGVKLIITVDQGIVLYHQAERAKKLGLDLIITDHHPLGEKKPKALAIIHTTKLAGCGVAWFLVKQLGVENGLDLVTIGTITDIVSLIGPNRSLVKYGLKEVQRTKRLGLQALYDFAGLKKEKIDTYEVGFIIGPRLNAAGRMEDPMESLRLICTSDENRAISLAQKIDQQNRERQNLTEQTIIHARELWLKEDKQNYLIFVTHESYQEGVLGLVAGKLTEEFYLPAIVISRGEKFSRASARSIKEFNILEAIRACADVIGAHGGHPKAAGFDIQTEKIEILKERLSKIVQKKLKGQELMPSLKIDLELAFENLSLDFYNKLTKLEPFGEGNPQPVFATHGVKVVESRTVGNGNRHLKLRLASSREAGSRSAGHVSRLTFDAIGFGMADFSPQLSPEKTIDIAYNLLLDKWNGRQRLQLKLKDIKIPHGRET